MRTQRKVPAIPVVFKSRWSSLMSRIISHPTEPALLDLPKVGTKSTEPSLMRVRSVLEVDVAVEALQHVARYDSMRLETYRQKKKFPKRICGSRAHPARGVGL